MCDVGFATVGFVVLSFLDGFGWFWVLVVCCFLACLFIVVLNLVIWVILNFVVRTFVSLFDFVLRCVVLIVARLFVFLAVLSDFSFAVASGLGIC